MKSILLPLISATLILSPTTAVSQEIDRHYLFDDDEVLHITLSGAIRELVQDRGDDMDYHALTLSYKEADGTEVAIPLKGRTRGHFRRKLGDCEYPPILLNFPKKKVPDFSIFNGQNKIKLVTPCKGEEYVVREYLIYKAYNVLTPKSFLARLVRVIYEDTVRQKSSGPKFGILLEDEDDMAKRNGAKVLEDSLVRPELTNRDDYLSMAVFEYLIGNTDWSVKYSQNVKVIAGSEPLLSTVPYDFDHSGLVRAPYARPAEALRLSSVRERRYRGFCMDSMAAFESVFSRFNLLRDEICAVYSKNTLLKDNYIKSSLKYIDEFYETINDPVKAEKEFTYPCNEKGTGNVVIKGLD